MILMMTGIGTSHLITAPTAGGRFAYELLWCIPIAYLSKYYGFEAAFRFTHATGKSLLEAYATAWGKWPLWYVLITTLIQSAIGQAGRLIAASAVLYYFFDVAFGIELPMAIYGLFLGVVSVCVILGGSYHALETITKFLAGILFVSTIAVYFVKPVPFETLEYFVSFSVPDGSWLVVAAFLGLLPTGIDVSLQASEWGKAKGVGMGKIRPSLERDGLTNTFDPFKPNLKDLAVHSQRLPTNVRKYCAQWYKIGLLDFRLGHIVSFILATIFLLLAAVWLYPSPITGRAVIGEIAGIFTKSVGPWMMMLFLIGAFAATFSTAFNYFDGWPRIVGACCRNLFRSTAQLQGVAATNLSPDHRRKWCSEYNIYRGTMIFSLLSAVGIIAGMPRPVFLVLVASALAFVIAPAIFFFNIYYCMTVIPKQDRLFYPSRITVWLSWFSLIIFSGTTALLILTRLWGINLFG
tara:strand:- start:2499 stop:3890 length:1392 start_codon:yes stop_codon:yes gene_type:complete